MTPEEQLLVELVNRARLDPVGEVARLGMHLNDGLPAGAIQSVGKQPLAPNDLIAGAAEAHSSWMISNDVFSHTGKGASLPYDRMESSGYSFSGSWAWAENIAWTSTSDLTTTTDFANRV